MKYSDEQRIQKILEYSVKLNDYIKENEITKDKLMKEYSLQWLEPVDTKRKMWYNKI